MDDVESRERMAKMRDTVSKYDIVYWIDHVFANFAHMLHQPAVISKKVTITVE